MADLQPTQPLFAQPQAESSLDLRQYVRTIVNHIWTVVLMTVLVGVGTTVWTLRQPRIYAAQATVAVELSTPKVLDGVHEVVELGSVNAWSNRGYMDLKLADLKSQETAANIAQRLASDPTFVPMSQRESAMKWLPGYVRATLRPSVAKDSRMVVIAAEDLIPERATRLVNTAAEVFVEMNLDQKLQATVGASDWLVTQVDELQTKLESSEVALHKFKEEHDILGATIEDRQSMNSSDLIALAKALTDVRLKKVEVEVRYRQMQGAVVEAADGGLGLRAVPQVYQSTTVTERYNALQQALADRAELLTRYGSLHPKVQAADNQIKSVEEELAKEYRLIMQVEQRTLDQLHQQETAYQAAFDRAKQEAFEVNRNEVAYSRLKRQQANNERLYELVLRRQKEADLSSANRFNNMRIMDRASVSTVPVRPNNTRNATLGILVGLFLGIALAFLLEFLDNTVKSPQDVENKLGLVFLGVMPSIKGKIAPSSSDPNQAAEANTSRDLHVHQFPKSAVAECCRAVRTNLLFMTPDTPLRTLVITSPGPQEGKTTVAISLGIAMAQSGSRTLLVDTDLRRPRIHKTFHMPNQVGITTALVGDTDLKEAIRSTEIPGLSILPCGPIPPNPAELLHTARFQEVLRRLTEQFDKVILDSPPVGAVADSLILSSYVDGVVVALRSMKTTKDLAARAKRALEDVNAHVFGVVLNDLDLERRAGYYTYYQSRYGYVYGDGEEGRDRAAA